MLGKDQWRLLIHQQYFFAKAVGFNTESLWALTRSPVIGSFVPIKFCKTADKAKQFFNLLKKNYESHNILTAAVSK